MKLTEDGIALIDARWISGEPNPRGADHGGYRPVAVHMEQARTSMAHLAEFPIRMTHCFHGGFVGAGSETIARSVQRDG